MDHSDKFLFDRDIDLDCLLERTVAIIGYGSQGRSHALNLRDSGLNVVVGQRPGAGFERAVADGFQPLEVSRASQQADTVAIMLPDELHGEIFRSQIEPELVPGDCVITCHGFSLHYQQIQVAEGVKSLMVAPKAAGHRVRSAFTEGGGVPCLVALGPGAEQNDLQLGLAYAKALGGGRAGVLQTTLREETETDLFGEQAVLCGGVSHLVKAGFQTLVDAGYPAELAYFECVQELKLVVDLLHQGGLGFMRDHISNTAEYGDYTRGPVVIGPEAREGMRQILSEIQSGKFASEWLAAAQEGASEFQQLREKEKELLIEKVGQKITALKS